MIEINLLPENLRKKKQFQFNIDLQANNVKIIGGGALLGVLIVLIIFFSVGSSIRKAQVSRLIKREQAMAQQTSQAETISRDVSILSAKIAALDDVTQRSFLWARKLNQLSDLVLPGIWFTRIYMDSGNRLILEGSVISRKEEAMASVGKFMKDLSEDEAFFKDFTNVKLESVERQSLDKRDVVEFKVVLYFRGA
ncbi:MAG: PilN domain-containing protein [Candidatus Omnitrophica bacterium]|nr:PilN domain-containing protein [Candidatus Omnitrophota bacterium]